jgi:aminoglycoside phosphotransferase (APT) family kinase protein
LLVKYEDATRRHTGHGYWGDETYEAMVYRDVLAQLGADVPRFYGLDETPSGRWLVIEYVDGERLSKSPREALVTAARWLGGFHRAGEDLVARDSCAAINVLDAAYFRGWAERAGAFTRPRQAEHPWLEAVCTAFAAIAPSLATGEMTVVHGEYYPRNILLAGDSVFPVDWQSAAVGPGEIDVASLIEGWGHGEIVASAVDAYAGTRWPHGEPNGFRRRLELARAYWPLRWLGDDPAWSVSPKRAHYIDELASAAQDAGLWDRGGAS